MRNISISPLHPPKQQIHYTRHYEITSKPYLPSFNTTTEIHIPPLNLNKPQTAHSFIFQRPERGEKPEISTHRQDDYKKLTQRTHQSDKYTQQLLTERRGREEALLKEIKMLRLQNEYLKREIGQYKRQERKDVQKLKEQVERLAFQKKEILNKLELAERKPKNIYENSKEILLYSEIIEKLERRVELLLKETKTLKSSLQTKVHELFQAKTVFKAYDALRNNVTELEQMINEDTCSWQTFKKQWARQKQYYLQVINRLESQVKSN